MTYDAYGAKAPARRMMRGLEDGRHISADFPELRDEFAMAAMSGILANSENVAAGAEPTNSAVSGPGYPDWLALTAYRLADAMMKARG